MIYLIQYYHHKRGKQAKTLIRESQHHADNKSNSPYPKILEELWQGKSFQNPLYDNQDHESGGCSCKCTPIPQENRARHSERKPALAKEGY